MKLHIPQLENVNDCEHSHTYCESHPRSLTLIVLLGQFPENVTSDTKEINNLCEIEMYLMSKLTLFKKDNLSYIFFIRVMQFFIGGKNYRSVYFRVLRPTPAELPINGND